MIRFEELRDYVIIKCKLCGSEEVDLWCDRCEECGDSIHSVCNDCGAIYDYHNFKEKEIEAKQ